MFICKRWAVYGTPAKILPIPAGVTGAFAATPIICKPRRFRTPFKRSFSWAAKNVLLLCAPKRCRGDATVRWWPTRSVSAAYRWSRFYRRAATACISSRLSRRWKERKLSTRPSKLHYYCDSRCFASWRMRKTLPQLLRDIRACMHCADTVPYAVLARLAGAYIGAAMYRWPSARSKGALNRHFLERSVRRPAAQLAWPNIGAILRSAQCSHYSRGPVCAPIDTPVAMAEWPYGTADWLDPAGMS